MYVYIYIYCVCVLCTRSIDPKKRAPTEKIKAFWLLNPKTVQAEIPPKRAKIWKFLSMDSSVESTGDSSKEALIPFSFSSSNVYSLWGIYIQSEFLSSMIQLDKFTYQLITHTCAALPKQRIPPSDFSCESLTRESAVLSFPLLSSSSTLSRTCWTLQLHRDLEINDFSM